MDKQLEILFANVSVFRSLCELEFPHEQVLIKHNAIFTTSADKISDYSKRLSKEEKTEIVKNYEIDLYRFHDTLCGTFAKARYKKLKETIFRSNHDKIFGAIGIKNPQTKFQYIVTRIFNEFVKGITFFQSEEDIGNPVYHRSDSCGDSNTDRSVKFTKDPSDLDVTYAHKKKVVKMCYVERLIYNAIYINVFQSYQDMFHNAEIQHMARLYEEYYPNYNLDIKVINARDSIYPETLYIMTRVGRKIDQEEYVRDWKTGSVRCLRNMNGVLFDKTQSFVKEEKWQLSDEMKM